MKTTDNIQKEQTLDLLQMLIRTNTVDPPGNELDAAKIVSAVLSNAEVESKIYELGDNRANLIARIPGDKSAPNIIFSAHFDTINVDHSRWTRDPFGAEIDEGRLYGRGSTDMKSGMSAMITAAIAIKKSNIILKGDLVLAFSAAENSSCLGAAELVKSGELDGAGALLVSEPSSMKVFIAQKGALWLTATAVGEYGHNAFSEDRVGDRGNAIVRMSQFIARIPELKLEAPLHPHLKLPTINVGLIKGGLMKPLIPEECTASIDIRIIPGMDPENVLAQFRSISGPHIKIEIEDYKTPVDTPESDPFVKICEAACAKELGYSPEVTGVSYYSDGTIIAPALNLPMVIIGPGEVGMSGAVDEYVEIENLHASARIFMEIAEKYLT